MQRETTKQSHRFEAVGDFPVTIEAAATAARMVYGSQAKTAVAWCAINARSDGRAADYSFWLRVFKEMRPDASDS